MALGDRVYFLKPPGILVCCDVADGRVLWQLRLKGPFWATPVLADGHIYVVNHDGLVQIVELGQEGKLVAEGRIDEAILASPAVADGAIFFRSNANLWKVAMPRKPAAAYSGQDARTREMTETIEIRPIGPLRATIRPPGSKSNHQPRDDLRRSGRR